MRPTFLDPDYAVRMWTTLPDWPAAEREYNRYKAAYEAWKPELRRDGWAALEALDHHPDREAIQRGHDLAAVFEIWKSVYKQWRGRQELSGATEWNATTDKTTCHYIVQANILTRECNDIPDWRSEKAKAHDAQVLADYRAKQAAKGAAQ